MTWFGVFKAQPISLVIFLGIKLVDSSSAWTDYRNYAAALLYSSVLSSLVGRLVGSALAVSYLPNREFNYKESNLMRTAKRKLFCCGS